MPSVNQSVNPLNGSFLGCVLKSVPIIFQYFLLSFYKVDSSNLALNVNEELFLFLLETSGRKGKKKPFHRHISRVLCQLEAHGYKLTRQFRNQNGLQWYGVQMIVAFISLSYRLNTTENLMEVQTANNLPLEFV